MCGGAGLASKTRAVQAPRPLQSPTPPPPARAHGPRELLAVRAFYFFTYGALGTLFPFLPLLLETRGLSPESISLVLVVVPIINLFVPPVWGLVADALQARVALLRAAAVGSGLSCLALLPARGVLASAGALSLLSLFRAPLSSLADSIAWTPARPGRSGYSLVRVWGSIGFAVGAVAVGRLKARLGSDIVVFATSASYLLAAASTLPLRSRGDAHRKPVVRPTAEILKRPAVLAFLAACVAYYVAHGAYDAFFSLHLRRIGFDDSFIGTAWATGVVVEIGVMLISPWLLRRWSNSALLAACSVVAVIRWLLLAQVRSAPAVLSAQTLHGITFGLWYLALVDRVQQGAPEHLRTSLQSVTSAAMALGMVGGYLLGGATLSAQGASLMFLLAAGASAAAFVLYLAQARPNVYA